MARRAPRFPANSQGGSRTDAVPRGNVNVMSENHQPGEPDQTAQQPSIWRNPQTTPQPPAEPSDGAPLGAAPSDSPTTAVPASPAPSAEASPGVTQPASGVPAVEPHTPIQPYH